jgi:hypothetical protein
MVKPETGRRSASEEQQARGSVLAFVERSAPSATADAVGQRSAC